MASADMSMSNGRPRRACRGPSRTPRVITAADTSSYREDKPTGESRAEEQLRVLLTEPRSALARFDMSVSLPLPPPLPSP